MAEDETIGTVDIVVIVVYFVFVIGVGFASMCRENRGTSKGYFLAGRDMMWFLVGASLFASNIGSYHFVGLAGSGASAGWGVAAFELNALYLLQLLGWVFLPVYITGGIYTMPEYLKKRFGGERIRVYYAVLSLLLYIFTKISVDMFSGAIFIQESLGWSLWTSIGVLLGVTAIYTMIGGLAAVMFTDTVQFIIMIGGGVTLMIICFLEVGGLTGLVEKYPYSYPNETLYENNTCGIPRDDAFKMWRDPIDSDMPWPGFFLGQMPASLWYWCADQVIVQRSLAAKNLAHAKGGSILAGYFKILPMFMIIMPGMIARILWPDEIACIDEDICDAVCNNPSGCTNVAYPRLVMRLLPIGLRGLMLAVMLSALMSSLTSIFNSGSTIFTIDIWKRIRRHRASERELMVVGRVFVLILVLVSILWIPIIARTPGGELWHYIQEISGYLTPPIAAIFLLAVLWGRLNEQGTFWSLMIGLLGGVIRFILIIIYPEPPCGEEDTRPAIIANVHYFYVATILFWLTIILGVIISLLTKPIPKEKLYGLTYWTRHSKEDRIDIDETDDVKQTGSSNMAYDNEIHMSEIKSPPEGSDLSDDGSSDSAIGSHNGEEKGDIKATYKENGKNHYQSGYDTDMESVVADDEYKKSTGCRRVYDWICGFSSNTEHKMSVEERKAMEAKLTDISQTKEQTKILNINLVLISIVGLVLCIIFGFDFLWV
ncbi:sodium/glucose cotransporter 4-like [Glandiceps talaboti]